VTLSERPQAKGSRQRKTVFIGCRMTPEQHDFIAAAAHVAGRSKSSVLRGLVEGVRKVLMRRRTCEAEKAAVRESE
jgi:uncharacterized protein (DUF1778 family)